MQKNKTTKKHGMYRDMIGVVGIAVGALYFAITDPKMFWPAGFMVTLLVTMAYLFMTGNPLVRPSTSFAKKLSKVGLSRDEFLPILGFVVFTAILLFMYFTAE